MDANANYNYAMLNVAPKMLTKPGTRGKRAIQPVRTWDTRDTNTGEAMFQIKAGQKSRNKPSKSRASEKTLKSNQSSWEKTIKSNHSQKKQIDISINSCENNVLTSLFARKSRTLEMETQRVGETLVKQKRIEYRTSQHVTTPTSETNKDITRWNPTHMGTRLMVIGACVTLKHVSSIPTCYGFLVSCLWSETIPRRTEFCYLVIHLKWENITKSNQALRNTPKTILVDSAVTG